MTETRTFGASGRVSHDASGYYDRALFDVDIDSTTQPVPPPETAVDQIFVGRSETMTELPANSVGLLVTSPPYHVGKDYDTDEGFDEYLEMLQAVFTESYRVLEPGARACINVAGLGRKPYIALPDIVGDICQDIGFHRRGEVIWQKAEGANGSCAWGSWMSPSNPTLRDVHEYILMFSKGRFDRTPKPKRRRELGMPWESTITREDFMELTLSIWKFGPEHAKRVQHPAPFPIELPRRCMELYSFKGDLVLDPFLGSGTTACAAVRTGRHYVGYDLDPAYVDTANQRIAKERAMTEGAA